MFIHPRGTGRAQYKGDTRGEKGVIPEGLLKPLSTTNYRTYFTNENLRFNITVLILKGFFFLHNNPCLL